MAKVSRKNRKVLGKNRKVSRKNKQVLGKNRKVLGKNRKVSRKNRPVKSNKSRKSKELNEYFVKMLKAKKEGAQSFEYKNKTYYGREHDRLGMVYSSKRPKTV